MRGRRTGGRSYQTDLKGNAGRRTGPASNGHFHSLPTEWQERRLLQEKDVVVIGGYPLLPETALRSCAPPACASPVAPPPRQPPCISTRGATTRRRVPRPSRPARRHQPPRRRLLVSIRCRQTRTTRHPWLRPQGCDLPGAEAGGAGLELKDVGRDCFAAVHHASRPPRTSSSELARQTDVRRTRLGAEAEGGRRSVFAEEILDPQGDLGAVSEDPTDPDAHVGGVG